MTDDFLVLKWEELYKLTYELAKQVEQSPIRPDLIVAIARGGLTISHILSDFLRLPVASFTVSSYKDMQQTQTPVVSFGVGGELNDRSILLVDDVSDHGVTFQHGVGYLKEHGATSIRTASVFTKPWTTFVPDFHIRQVSEWIVFPFEIRETIEALSKKWGAEGLAQQEIEKQLMIMGLETDYVKRYL